MFKKLSILAASVMMLTGCASMFQGSTQNFQVSTANDQNPENTRCSIVNEEGAWQTVPNSMVSIHRDGNNMQIQCNNTTQSGSNSADPNFSGGYFVLDLVGAGLIGLTIDGINNALYEYPSFVTVSMRDDPSKKSSSAPTSQRIETPKIEDKTGYSSGTTTGPVTNRESNTTSESTSSSYSSPSSRHSTTTTSPSSYSHSNSGYFTGPRGGCYTYTSGGRKRYVAHSFCGR
ncbi:MAG: hypothetical protein WBI40_09415 [Methylococcaceae bacterium]